MDTFPVAQDLYVESEDKFFLSCWEINFYFSIPVSQKGNYHMLFSHEFTERNTGFIQGLHQLGGVGLVMERTYIVGLQLYCKHFFKSGANSAPLSWLTSSLPNPMKTMVDENNSSYCILSINQTCYSLNTLLLFFFFYNNQASNEICPLFILISLRRNGGSEELNNLPKLTILEGMAKTQTQIGLIVKVVFYS